MRQDHRWRSGERVRSESRSIRRTMVVAFLHPERRTVEGLSEQGGCGVFRLRQDRSQHGGDEQVDQREGDQGIQPSCKFIIGEVQVMQTSMDVKLIISEGRQISRASTSRGGVLEITNLHQPTPQSTTRVGALMAHHPAWVSHHTGGSRSIPTVHPKRVMLRELTNSTQVPRVDEPK